MRRRAAFTIIEVSISSVVVALMVAAALSVAAGAHRTRVVAAERAEASRMAFETLAELHALAFPDPAVFTLTLGAANILVLQAAGGAQLDVITQGAPLPPADPSLAAAGWQRVVRVSFYNPPTQAATRTDTGIILMEVVVQRNGRELARAQTLRSRVGRS